MLGSAVQYHAVQYNALHKMPFSAVHYNAVLKIACSAVQNHTVPYNAMPSYAEPVKVM